MPFQKKIVFNNKIKAFLKLGFYLHHSGHVCHRVIVLCLCTVSSQQQNSKVIELRLTAWSQLVKYLLPRYLISAMAAESAQDSVGYFAAKIYCKELLQNIKKLLKQAEPSLILLLHSSNTSYSFSFQTTFCEQNIFFFWEAHQIIRQISALLASSLNIKGSQPIAQPAFLLCAIRSRGFYVDPRAKADSKSPPTAVPNFVDNKIIFHARHPTHRRHLSKDC